MPVGKKSSTNPQKDKISVTIVVPPTEVAHGDYLITLAEGGETEAAAFLEEKGGMSSMSSTEELSADQLGMEVLPRPGSGTLFFRLGVAVAKLDANHLARLQDVAQGEKSILAIERAPIFFAASSWDQAFLQGYEAGVKGLIQSLAGLSVQSTAIDEAGGTATWGLNATRVEASRATGRGVRVAILDTGLDLLHPDFAGRSIQSRSFIVDEPVQDGHGHGTHCAGTACGPRKPRQGPRYGIAHEAEIFIGKVLSNSGGSRGRSVELGMEWALANRCDIISMSLGSPVLPNQGPIQAYERIGSRALSAGMMFVAAAGNDSVRRRGLINPVGSPANVPSILAVGALDQQLAVADFSNGGINGNGGDVDIAGPGVGVYSSIPGGYGLKSGTSMATPHIAGLAALHAEITGHRGRALWEALTESAKALPLAPRDVGSGIGQAP